MERNVEQAVVLLRSEADALRQQGSVMWMLGPNFERLGAAFNGCAHRLDTVVSVLEQGK